MISFKERTIDYDKPVRVFRNLTRRGVCYSIQQKGITVAHAYIVHLMVCKFHVNQKARERVIRKQRKEVHAYIEGVLTNIFDINMLKTRVYYNPYKYETFVDSEGNIMNEAKYVTLDMNGVRVLLK